MGLFDGLLNGAGMDDPRMVGLFSAAAGMLNGAGPSRMPVGLGQIMGQGLSAGMQGYQGAQDQQLKQKAFALQQSANDLQQRLGGLQMQKGGLEVTELERKLADEDKARKLLQGIYGTHGLPQSPMPPTVGGGQLGSGTFGLSPPLGTTSPTPPTGAQMPDNGLPAPTQALGGVTPKSNVWQQYKNIGDQMAAAGLVDKAQVYYGLAEKFRPKFNPEPRVVMGPDGKLVNVIVSEDGSTQTLPFGVKPNIKMQSLGDRVVAVDENTATNGQSWNMGQSPDSKASNAVTIRGQNMTDARARDQIELGRVPSGYRQKSDGSGLEFIPGGPADPNAAKKAAPTEFQGKSAAYGARAQEADKIITGLEGKYWPAAVNAKIAAGEVPFVGGAYGATANTLLTENGQKAEQAQRDFVNAILRQESGAAISASEFENARKQYFPQPGDSAGVIAQKARNRQIAIQGFRENSRPGAVDAVANAGGAPTLRFNPQTGKMEKVN